MKINVMMSAISVMPLKRQTPVKEGRYNNDHDKTYSENGDIRQT